jgi:hypothetical protein
MKQFTQEGMFNELSKVTRAINNKNMSKYDLPTYGKGGEDPVKPVDTDKDYLIRMANSPLFVERYARMVGKPIDQVGEEAEAYRKEILNNIETVKINDIGVYPKGVKKRDMWDKEGVYYPDLKKEDIEQAQQFINEQPAYSRKAYQNKLNKQIANYPTHNLFLLDDNPWVRTHELSHGSVRGDINAKNVNAYSFTKLPDFPALEKFYDNQKDYLTMPDEQKARVDVTRKYLEKKGLYDPVNEPFTEKQYYQLIMENLNSGNSDAPDDLEEISIPYDKETVIKMFNDFVSNDSKKELDQARLGGLAKFVDGGGTEYSFSGRPDSRYKKINNQWYINNSTTGGKFVAIEDPSGERTQILNSKATPVSSFQSPPMVNNVLLTNGKSSKEYYVQQNQFSPEITKNQLAAKYKEQIRQEAVKNKLAEEQKRYRASIPKGPVADNMRTVIPGNAVSDINNTAILNSPEYKAKEKAKKEAQAEFEKQTWEDYDKMSFGEKALDRVQAGMVDPLGMISRAVTGEQAYIPGMGRGLLNHDSENYENYLNSVGYTPGEFEASDLQNMLNPMYWGASAGNQFHKGNYGQGALETALAVMPFLPKGTASLSNVKYGSRLLADDAARLTQRVKPNLSNANSFVDDAFRSSSRGLDDGVLRSNVSSDFAGSEYLDNSALEYSSPGAGSKLGNNDKFTFFDENWEHFDAYKDNPNMGVTGDMAEKFALENPDKFTKVTFDDYDSWLYGKTTREAQQKAFADGKEFAHKWVVKDQKYFDDVNAIIKEKNNDMMHNAHIVNGVDVRASFHKLRQEAQEKALQDLNISSDDFIESLGKMGKGDRIVDAQVEAVRLERDSHLSKLVNSSPENLKLHDDYIAYEQRYSALQNDRDALRESLDAAIDPEYKRKVEELYAMSGQTDVPATMSSVEFREPKLVNVNRTDPSFKELDPYNQDYLLKNNQRIGGVRTYNNTITLGARPTSNDVSFRYFTKNNQAENIGNRVNHDGLVVKEARFSKPSTWLNAFKKPTYKTYPDTELGRAQQRLERTYGHEINIDDIELAERIEQELIRPQTIEEVNAHEIFHDLQNTNGRWMELFNDESQVEKYAYNTTHEKTAIAKEFKTYMVDPVEATVDAAGEKVMSNETWLASVGELHSELGVARLRAAKKYMNEYGLNMDEAIATLKNLEKKGDPDLYDFYLEYGGGDLNKHFKDTAPVEIKRQLLKILPVAIPAIGLTGLSLQDETSPMPTQQKYGGNISNLQKFIK